MNNTETYKCNYDDIFGDKPIQRGSWVYDKESRKLIPKDEYYALKYADADAPQIMKPIDEFVSPIDGKVITDRSKLRKHNAEHGVTDYRDYGDNYFDKKKKEQEADRTGKTRKAKEERKQLLVDAFRKNGEW